ncbi:30297_t:CDS:2, partial [Racocetra persica]
MPEQCKKRLAKERQSWFRKKQKINNKNLGVGKSKILEQNTLHKSCPLSIIEPINNNENLEFNRSKSIDQICVTNLYTFNIVTDNHLRVNLNSIEQICATNSYPFNIINDKNLRVNRPKIIEQNCATNLYTFNTVEPVINNLTLQLERSDNSKQSRLSNLDFFSVIDLQFNIDHLPVSELLSFPEVINTNISSVMFRNKPKPEFEQFYLSKSVPLCAAEVTSTDAFSAHRNVVHLELGRMNQTCTYYNAKFWIEERDCKSNKTSPTFAICCSDSKCKGIMDALHTGDGINNIGQCIILPSIFVGGSHQMYQLYQDTIAIIWHFGKLDFFRLAVHLLDRDYISFHDEEDVLDVAECATSRMTIFDFL